MPGVDSLKDAYYALGLPSRKVSAIPDETINIEQKVTNPRILQSLGVDDLLVEACYNVELAANLLDSFAETGHESFLNLADKRYQSFLSMLPKNMRELMKLITASALSYFHLEQYFSKRIKREDQITLDEVIHYHLSRGADSQVYAEIAKSKIPSKGLISGFRYRQALWDLADEIEDLSHDVRKLGVNILLMANLDDRGRLNDFADSLFIQSKELDIPPPLFLAIEKEYQKVKELI